MKEVTTVIFVILDSLRKDCIECLGSPPWGKVYTPNLNKFARESFTVKKCYPETLPTLPARRAIYTGKRVFPFDEGLMREKGDFAAAVGWKGLSENNKTISEVLQENGFITALISDIQHMFKPSKNFHRGFDEWLWIRGYEADNFRSGPTPGQKDIDYWLPKELQNEKYVRFLSQCLMNVHGIAKEEDYFVARVMREAVRWLEQNMDKEKKFLLIESWSPHEPWFIPKHYRDMYIEDGYPQQVLSLYREVDDIAPEIIKSTQANYSGHVTMCDTWFGYLYESIKKLGLLDNTLIIVTTDHGHSIGDNNYLGKRGYPSTPEVFDIPILLRHPDDTIGRGKETDMLVQHTDITPTILDILSIEAWEGDYYRWDDWVNVYADIEMKPEPRKKLAMHGKSFFPALLENRKSFRDHVTAAWDTAITVITKKWWFNCKVNGKGAFLYDLEHPEPFQENMADTNPEVVKELFDVAKHDAGGNFPAFLIELADKKKDAAGCSELAARTAL
jgi:arylsulfatase A-like enzyme